MEIQAQTLIPMNTGNGSNLNASVANANPATAGITSLTGQSSTDFSTTLNGILSMVPGTTATTPTALSGLNVLVQLLTTLISDTTETEGQSNEDSIKQLDLLMGVINEDTKEASNILENPEVQAWLSEIQVFLMMQPQAPVSNKPLVLDEDEVSTITQSSEKTNNLVADRVELNPLLFVAIEPTKQESQGSREHITKAGAYELLDTFKQLLKADNDKIALPQVDKAMQIMVDHMQKLLASVVEPSSNVVQSSIVAQASTENKANPLIVAEVVAPIVAEKPSHRAFGTVSPLSSRTGVSKGNNADIPFQVVLTTTNPKLEYLAANFVQTKLTVDDNGSDQPLFEPLQEHSMDSTNESPAIPMHEFLKQVPTSQPLMKPPVIIMQAPTFVDDMTQFVIKSFTLETKSEGFTEAKLSLYPQNLGQVDVKLTMHNGHLVAHFMADSSMGKEMLESQLPQLRTTLQSQGIQVERMEVSQNQAFQSGMFQEQRQQQSQQSNKQQQGNSADKILSLDEEINQEVPNSVIAPRGLEKTSIDTTA